MSKNVGDSQTDRQNTDMAAENTLNLYNFLAIKFCVFENKKVYIISETRIWIYVNSRFCCYACNTWYDKKNLRIFNFCPIREIHNTGNWSQRKIFWSTVIIITIIIIYFLYSENTNINVSMHLTEQIVSINELPV